LVASPFATPSLTKIAVLIASASLQKTIVKTSKHDISETARFLLSLTFCISPCLGSPWNKVELETSTAANPFEALEATGVHLGPGRDQLLDHCAMAFPSCSIQCCVASARGEEVTLSGMEVRLDGIGSCMVSQHHIRFLIVVCKKTVWVVNTKVLGDDIFLKKTSCGSGSSISKQDIGNHPVVMATYGNITSSCTCLIQNYKRY
jgi:hypothetical protein